MRKRPRDPNQLAKMLVDIVAGDIEDREPTPEEQGKDPATMKRGRLGGGKGGDHPFLLRDFHRQNPFRRRPGS